jgi:hypothetical protein
MKAPSIDLHIEELVLRGFEPGEEGRIGQAVQREMARLLAEGNVPPSLAQGGEIAHLDGGTFDVAPGSGAEAIGAQVAQAVYRGLADGC